uniref:Uncharacterized protein n=1 Tax=Cucumis melo TaxID=3656 RepID=A0A9I9DNZ1_CUCME
IEFRCPRLDFSSPWNLICNTISEFGIAVWDPTYYTPLLVLHQVWLKQFIPPTHNLQESDFSYDLEDCQGKKRRAICAWKSVSKIKKQRTLRRSY